MKLELFDETLISNLENSYSPYSKYKVSALLFTKDGTEVFKGVNVENHGIQSICAERAAFISAISAGKKEFSMIYIAAKKEDGLIDEDVLPCGYCLQFISEFVKEDFKIIIRTNDVKRPKIYTLKDLLPKAFTKEK